MPSSSPSPSAWHRPASRDAWLAEIQELSRHTSVYQPNLSERHALGVAMISCAAACLILGRVHGVPWIEAPPGLAMGVAMVWLGWYAVEAFRYPTQPDRVRLTEIQPAELEAPDRAALRKRPELGAHVHDLSPMDVPILYGDLLALRRAYAALGIVPEEDGSWDLLDYILIPFIVTIMLVMGLAFSGLH